MSSRTWSPWARLFAFNHMSFCSISERFPSSRAARRDFLACAICNWEAASRGPFLWCESMVSVVEGSSCVPSENATRPNMKLFDPLLSPVMGERGDASNEADPPGEKRLAISSSWRRASSSFSRRFCSFFAAFLASSFWRRWSRSSCLFCGWRPSLVSALRSARNWERASWRRSWVS